MDGSNDGDGLGLALAGFAALPVFLFVVAWLIAAAVAGFIAQHRGRSGVGFFLVTFFFLGPLGPGFALVAARELDGSPPAPLPTWRAIPAGRRRFPCPRCGADNDIPDADTNYDCWRCDEHRNVQPKAAPAKKA